MSTIHTARVTDPSQLTGVLEGWGLRDVGPVVVVVGGASGLEDADRSPLARLIGQEILPAVAEARALLLTGGTDSGVMRLAGEARRADGGGIALVGVVPGALLASPAGAAGDGNGESAADGDEDTESGNHLQPDHTHALLVPGDRWGDETSWLYAAAGVMAGRRPVVTVVLNGGRVARMEVAESVRLGFSVIVVAGSGRAADEIATVLAGREEVATDDPDASWGASGLVRAVPMDEDGALRTALQQALKQDLGGSRMTQARAPLAPLAPQASYEDEMRALIDRMEVTDEQRMFLRSRWLDQVMYMGDRASEAKRRYYRFRLATVVGGVLVPALVSISLAAAGRWSADMDMDLALRLATFIVSAVVAVTASVEGFFRFGDRWRHYRVNAETLKGEGWQYLTHSGAYRRSKDPEQAFQAFASRVEEILRDDVDGFMSRVTSTAPIEKHDIFTKL